MQQQEVLELFIDEGMVENELTNGRSIFELLIALPEDPTPAYTMTPILPIDNISE